MAIAIGARKAMATPETHPTWIEFILGSALFTVFLPKIVDVIRAAWLQRRKEDSAVRVKEIDSEDRRYAELWEEVKSLRKAETEHMQREIDRERRIGDLSKDYTQLKADYERERTDRLRLEEKYDKGIMKLEQLIAPEVAGGNLEDLITAVRTLIVELREARGHDAYPRSVVIGDKERTQGTA